MKDLAIFGITPSPALKNKLKKFWPGRVSVVMPCSFKKLTYLHRGKKKLAFRLPAQKSLRNFLSKTGPLVAPSANPEGFEAAKNTKEAKKYFGKKIDFYYGIKKLNCRPSNIIEITKNRIIFLRKSAAT